MTIAPADLGLPSRFPSFREYKGFSQLATAADIANADVRFPMVCAPPGAGKSLTYATAHALLAGSSTIGSPHRTLVLVGTKNLMSQLLDDFAAMGMASVRGHRNYSCMAGVTVDADGDEEGLCRRPRACGYKLDVDAVAGSKLAVTTYALWMSLARYADPGVLGGWDLLVLDEAHTAPHWLADFCAVALNRKRARLLGTDLPKLDAADIPAWSAWAAEHVDTAREKMRTARKEDRGKARRLLLDLEMLASAAEMPTPWCGRDDGAGGGGVILQPVWGVDYAERYLFQGVPKVALVSATLTPATATKLGIPRGDSTFTEVPSPFPPANRPLIHVPTCKVDFRMGDLEWHRLIKTFDEFAGARLELGRNGLVHTRSYDYATKLAARSAHRDRMILYRGSAELRRAFAEHRDREEATILVGPSFEEGYDFSGDLARWQVILKCTVMDRRDPLVRARIDFDKGYPDEVAAEAILQMAGRPVRSDSDWAESAIFDSHWAHVRHAYFPTWFKAAWRWDKELPPPMQVRRIVGG